MQTNKIYRNFQSSVLHCFSADPLLENLFDLCGNTRNTSFLMTADIEYYESKSPSLLVWVSSSLCWSLGWPHLSVTYSCGCNSATHREQLKDPLYPGVSGRYTGPTVITPIISKMSILDGHGFLGRDATAHYPKSGVATAQSTQHKTSWMAKKMTQRHIWLPL